MQKPLSIFSNPPKFMVELVPKTCFYSNVRSQVTQDAWDWLRRETYKQANYQCEGCGIKGKMEAHEIWHYDDVKHIQKLHGLVCLCNKCHLSHHLGFASIQGRMPEIMKHLSKINKWTREETQLYVDLVFEVWFQRSQHKWEADLTFLDQFNIPYKKIDKLNRGK